MFTYLNVRNEIAFIKSSTAIPIIKFYSVLMENPNNLYVSLLNGINNDQARQITEMLNGDAFSAAANIAGIKSTSVADIFERILGGQFKQYVFAGDLLEFISHIRGINLIPNSQNPDKDDHYGKHDLLEFKEPAYKYPGINKLLDNTEIEYTEIKGKSGNAIQRVKDNIKTGACPICRENLCDTNETAIAKCCGMVFCGTCGIIGQKLKGNINTKGICANCRASISIKDMIYMENFDLDKIFNEDFEEEDMEKLGDFDADDPSESPEDNIPTKYNTIIKIILGKKMLNATRVDLHIKNIIKGSALAHASDIKKVLIFANFEESLKHVITQLKKSKITYWRLSGSARELNNTANKFTECNDTCALVINSANNCSGLNLQTATDLIFVHNISDPNVESQVIGRGHRMGRTTSLNVWYLQYGNEYHSMISSHGIRKMTTEEIANEKNNNLFEAITDNRGKCEL
jgi:hypothetical protein